MLAPSCTQACRIWASRSTVLASAAGSSAATFMVWASTISPENENVARRRRPVAINGSPHQLVAKAVAGVETIDSALDGQLESAVHEIKVMFETRTRRKRIVDARAGRQFAGEKFAVEGERRRRNRPAAEAGGGIDPLRLLVPPDKRRRLPSCRQAGARSWCDGLRRAAQARRRSGSLRRSRSATGKRGSLRSSRTVHRATSSARAAMRAAVRRGAVRR